MSHTYRFRIIANPNPQDLRPFPEYGPCEAVLDDILDLTDEEAAKLRRGEWIERDIWDHDVVRFHHERRAQGCCPRIKWEVG